MGALTGSHPWLWLPLVLAGLLAVILRLCVLVARRMLGPAAPWEAFLLLSFWGLTINVPTLFDVDPSDDRGLFTAESLARIAVFGVACALALVFLLAWRRQHEQRSQRVVLAAPAGASLLFSLYIWYLLEAPLVSSGTSLALTVFRALEWVVAFGFLYLLFDCQNTRGRSTIDDRLRVVLPMLFFPVGVTLLLLVVQPAMVLERSPLTGIVRLASPFAEPNRLAIIDVMLFAYTLAFWSGWRRLLMITICVLVLGFTYSRNGYIAFGVVLLASVLILLRHAGLQAMLCVLLVLGVVIAGEVPEVADNVEEFLSRGGDSESLTTLSERTAVWQAVRVVTARSPWLGEGFVVGPKGLGDIMIRNGFSYNFAAPHAHNELLQAQVSGGVLATLLSLAIQLRIAFLLAFRVALSRREKFFMWSVWLSVTTWSVGQPTLSYTLFLPGVLLGWALLTLEGLRRLQREAANAGHAPSGPSQSPGFA